MGELGSFRMALKIWDQCLAGLKSDRQSFESLISVFGSFQKQREGKLQNDHEGDKITMETSCKQTKAQVDHFCLLCLKSKLFSPITAGTKNCKFISTKCCIESVDFNIASLCYKILLWKQTICNLKKIPSVSLLKPPTRRLYVETKQLISPTADLKYWGGAQSFLRKKCPALSGSKRDLPLRQVS